VYNKTDAFTVEINQTDETPFLEGDLMAVLVEGISVVIRRDAIEAKIKGGWQSFQDIVPNQTLCTDGQLARVGFTSPDDVEKFTQSMESGGLIFQKNGSAKDFSVVDMLTGPTVKTPWLEFLCTSKTREISSCWLYEGPRDKGSGAYFPSQSLEVAVPYGWTYEESLTAHHIFVPTAPQGRLLGLMNGISTGIRRILRLGNEN